MLPTRAAEGEIKESRGGPLDEAGVQAVVLPKEKEKEREGEMRGGSGTGNDGAGQRADWTPGKEKCTVHKNGEHCTLSRPCENGTLMDPTSTAFAGHAAK